MTVKAAQVSTEIAASPSRVWAALTNTQTLKTFFFGSDIETSWREGSPIYFRGDWNGRKYQDKGTIEAFKPDETLSFTHWSDLSGVPDQPENYHIVTFALSPAGDRTRVTLTQENRNETESVTPESKKELEKNWTMVLDGLKKAVEHP